MDKTNVGPQDKDTIAAVATAAGRGGIGIVRISGKNSLLIGARITGKKLLPRNAVFCPFQNPDGQLVDVGVALFFSAPNSFTGEDVLELQAHGSPVVLDQLLAAALACGARMARPGEFSERAFLNNKIDLAQAEAIADLIAAETTAAAQSAQASLQGAFSKEINQLIDQMVALRAYIEAALDFPEEEIDFLATGNIAERLSALQEQIKKISMEAKQGSLITEGMTLVLAGKPNAGKSSLLNALSGQERAIVTPVAGTTRDILREHIQIDGMPLHIIDTAGLHDSNDSIEQEGIRRALNEIKKADHVLLVVDDSTDAGGTLEDIWPKPLGNLTKDFTYTVVRNKCDLSCRRAEKNTGYIALSAKTGAGMDILKRHLKEIMGYRETSNGRFSARRRHLQGLHQASQHIHMGAQLLSHQSAGELLAEELRLAQKELEVITGRFTSDDLLDKIFRDFCIGK